MLVFYGLGNNDSKYLQTKHNVGRIITQNLASYFACQFKEKDNYAFCKKDFEEVEVYFLYSLGYMNTIGNPLNKFIKYFKLPTNQLNFRLIILQDDSDQITGKQKLVVGGGTAGHKGIDSIYKNILSINLDLTRIWRLKIGIRPEGNKLKSETFVLSQISAEEKIYLDNLTKKCIQLWPDFLNLDLQKLQNQLN